MEGGAEREGAEEGEGYDETAQGVVGIGGGGGGGAAAAEAAAAGGRKDSRRAMTCSQSEV